MTTLDQIISFNRYFKNISCSRYADIRLNIGNRNMNLDLPLSWENS